MHFKTSVLFTVTALAFLLTGCISSKIPLFDEPNAVTPVPAGRYDQLTNNNGTLVKLGTGTLRLNGRIYGWSEDRGASEQLFALFDIGDGFYIAAGRQRNPRLGDPYRYELIEATEDGYLAYAPRCAELRKMWLPERLKPLVDGDDCFYVDREAVEQVLRLWAGRMLPTYRYIAAKP